jgi:surface antigen
MSDHWLFKKRGHRDPEHNPYIEKRDNQWVVLQKETGKVLSHHDTRKDAEASFRAMEMHKHGG